jgi:hypothetical protein
MVGRSHRDIAENGCKHERAIKVGRRQAVVKTRCDMAPSRNQMVQLSATPPRAMGRIHIWF